MYGNKIDAFTWYQSFDMRWECIKSSSHINLYVEINWEGKNLILNPWRVKKHFRVSLGRKKLFVLWVKMLKKTSWSSTKALIALKPLQFISKGLKCVHFSWRWSATQKFPFWWFSALPLEHPQVPNAQLYYLTMTNEAINQCGSIGLEIAIFIGK